MVSVIWKFNSLTQGFSQTGSQGKKKGDAIGGVYKNQGLEKNV